jgi:hypothetical protein
VSGRVLNIAHPTDATIEAAIKELINPMGVVYMDEMIKTTGLNRERNKLYLKSQGFVKNAGRVSKRWQNLDRATGALYVK